MKEDLKADARKLRELDKEMQMSFSGPLVSDAGVVKVLGVLAWALPELGACWWGLG